MRLSIHEHELIAHQQHLRELAHGLLGLRAAEGPAVGVAEVVFGVGEQITAVCAGDDRLPFKAVAVRSLLVVDDDAADISFLNLVGYWWGSWRVMRRT